MTHHPSINQTNKRHIKKKNTKKTENESASKTNMAVERNQIACVTQDFNIILESSLSSTNSIRVYCISYNYNVSCHKNVWLRFLSMHMLSPSLLHRQTCVRPAPRSATRSTMTLADSAVIRPSGEGVPRVDLKAPSLPSSCRSIRLVFSTWESVAWSSWTSAFVSCHLCPCSLLIMCSFLHFLFFSFIYIHTDRQE